MCVCYDYESYSDLERVGMSMDEPSFFVSGVVAVILYFSVYIMCYGLDWLLGLRCGFLSLVCLCFFRCFLGAFALYFSFSMSGSSCVGLDTVSSCRSYLSIPKAVG